MAIFIFFIFLLFLFILCFSITRLFVGLSIVQKILVYFLIIAADIVLVLEIGSLFNLLSSPLFLTLLQGIFSGISILINKKLKIGFIKIRSAQLMTSLRNLGNFLKEHKLLTTFSIFIVLNLILLAVCIIHFPQNISDGLYNYLSRIGFWIQQGSLKHYSAFSRIGMIYPYNSSLLISLPIIFLKTDIFSGFVQYFASLAICLSIYNFSRCIGFKKESSLFAALIFLTYTIVIYESTTAQNDLLVAAFITISISFLLTFIKSTNKRYLIFSLLGIALALGTNQYSLVILPGYLGLFLYGLIVTKNLRWKNILTWFCVFTVFFLFFGAYSDIQNMINFGNPLGPKGFVEEKSNISNISSIPQRLATNSSRLFVQFISCDGLPSQWAAGCLKTREFILRPIVAKNIESDQFLYNTATFSFLNANTYNAEMAWFGPISWILILPTFIYSFIISIKKRSVLNIILLIIPISFFLFIQLAKFGWDPYQGRYLILAIALVQPFTAWIFEPRKKTWNILGGLVCLFALFIMQFSTLNNASMPLVSKTMITDIEKWGRKNCTLIQKISYKLKPFIMADKDVWGMKREEIMVMANSKLIYPVILVEDHIIPNGSLGIMTDMTEFPDYLFRGSQVRRSLTRLKEDQSQGIQLTVDYILLAPEYRMASFSGFELIDQSHGWVLLLQQNE